jgi:hypothetical protein
MKRLSLVLVVMGLGLFLFVPVAAAEELTADDYVEFWRPVIGTWQGTIEIDGQAGSTTFRFRIAPNRKCILVSDEGDGPGLQQIQVYDPVAKHEIAWGVDKDGQRQIQTIVTDGVKKGMRAAKGVGGSWELKVFTNDGRTITETSKWVFTELSDTSVAIVWSDVRRDGEPKPDSKLILERQQPARKRRAQ